MRAARAGLAITLLALLAMPMHALAQSSDAEDAGADAPVGVEAEPSGTSTSSEGVTTEHHATHTSSSTTTHSGAAPAAHHDTSTDPVVDPVTQPATTTAAPAEAAEEDEGDGRDVDFLWIEVQGGISNVNLVQFQNQNFADVAAGAEVFNEVYGTGPAVALGVGFRIWWLAVGARASFAAYDTFQIGTVGGELTLRLPVPIVEPWVRVGFGYGWQGDASYQSGVTARETTTYGWAFQAGLGVDIYLIRWLTVGAGFGLDVLNMTRQRDPSVMCMGVTDVCPSMNGDALGLQLKGLITVGLRF
ncbi:MAG: hypothetical protein J0L92_22375 [Deltaproteobacteria bacterium]|nr:hypothetical protein [Deltaproteobacteria bacterium]